MVLKKYIGRNNSRHCYSYCMLSCSLLSEWLCEIAMDVQGYFHNSLLTHILSFCFYSGLLLLAFNHLGCILLFLYSHRNKQSSQNRYISLLNAVLVYFSGRCGLVNSHHASIYPHGLEPSEKQSVSHPDLASFFVCLVCF